MTTPKRTLAEIVQHYRWKASVSQAWLAQETGLSKSFISQLESGRYESMEPQRLQKIATALRAPLKEFLEAAGVVDAPDFPMHETTQAIEISMQDLRAAGRPERELAQLQSIWYDLPSGDQKMLVRMAQALKVKAKANQKPDKG